MDLDVYKKKVGDNIRAARKKRELTQEDMQKYGFNWRHYQEIEAGRINITIETLARLSKIFKVEVSELVK